MRRTFEGTLVVLAALLVLPARAGATYHLTSISEVGAGFLDDPDVQFVELRLDAVGQTQFRDTRLTSFDAEGNATELVLSDHALGTGTRGANVLYATAAFAAATGVPPDFVMPAGLAVPTGMVCWGAPGVTAPDPDTWDLADPDNYVDCVAYGGYDGPTRGASGTPSSLGPGDGTRALARTRGSGANGNNAADFALAAPDVCTNAGVCTDLAGAERCGDADGNGIVAVPDGVRALRIAAGLPGTCPLARCDVDGDGAVSVSDGIQILRAAASLPITGDCTPDD
jgi:hypothetical protein